MDTERACDVTDVEAIYLDCCLPGYFQGSAAQEILAVLVWEGITYKEAYEAAKDEFHASSGYFDEVAGSGSMVENALHAMFGSCIAGSRGDEVCDFARYIEPATDDDTEPCYLYIGLVAEY